ncbi:MAG: DUF2934 domain-containing protein [Gaiellales bacterium]
MSQHEDVVERIRVRAYEISQRQDAGLPEENWYRAEAEIRAEDAARRAAIAEAEEEAAIILETSHRNAFTHP